MVTEILRRTPPWVFILFFVLLAMGYSQSRDRIVAANGISLLPVAMIALSLYGAVSAFGITAGVCFYWLAGVAAAMSLGLFLVYPRGVMYARETGSFFVPGSWVPLLLMMAIFATKYAVGVVSARQLPIMGKPAFIAVTSLLYGFFSGLFLARAITIRGSMKTAAVSIADMPSCRSMVQEWGRVMHSVTIRSFLGYTWAVSAFFIVVATFVGHKVFSAKLAQGTGVVVSPWYTGGEIVGTYKHDGYRTLVHRPVFDGLLSDRGRGFIQVNWESERTLPRVIVDTVSAGADGRMAFTIRFDTETGKVVALSGGSSVLGLDKCVRLKNGWAVRVLLEKE